MSSAFGDFGPLTERRKAEKARQQRRRIMIAIGTVSIVVVLIVAGSFAVMYSGKSSSEGHSKSSSGSKGSSSPAKGKSGGGSHPATPSSDSGSESGSSDDSKPADLKAVSKSIKAMCSQTDYTDACEKSLSKAATVNASATSSPKDIVRAAVEVIGDAIGQAFDRADLIMSNDPRVKAAVADCKEIFRDAKDDLNRTVKGVNAKDGISKDGYQLRIWLSAVIAHMETCIDGFPDDDFKAKVKDSFTSGKELTSNALALIEKGSSILSAIKGISKRRLLEEDDDADAVAVASRAEPALDKDGIPEWVPNGERRVLKGGGFKNTLTPDVVVAKDGSGKFKTINEALAAMPKSNNGRYPRPCVSVCTLLLPCCSVSRSRVSCLVDT
jgi:pectinesterase inhibitor-like protein